VRVSLLGTCVVDLVEPHVGEATATVLRAAGCEVRLNRSQTCCGQPAWNAGHAEEAAAVARPTLAALSADLDAGADAVVVPAGSCAAMVRVFWPELFEVVGDHGAAERARRVGAATLELSELLADRADRLPPMALGREVAVAEHRACHALRELRLDGQPGDLVARVGGCSLVDLDDADAERCCGFGGTFSVTLPETSVAMADEKLDACTAAGADLVVSTDASCLLHLRSRAEARGLPLGTRHLAEVLAAALPPEARPTTDRPGTGRPGTGPPGEGSP
jgi:L-lactate dehydrogenase complex protein LldE